MPKFVIEREIPGAGNLTDAELREISRKSLVVLRGIGPEIQWLQSYVTGDKIYCVYLAPGRGNNTRARKAGRLSGKSHLRRPSVDRPYHRRVRRGKKCNALADRTTLGP